MWIVALSIALQATALVALYGVSRRLRALEASVVELRATLETPQPEPKEPQSASRQVESNVTPMAKVDSVRALARTGEGVEAIARQLGLGKGEVQLILDLGEIR